MINVDNSETAISHMDATHGSSDDQSWVVADATELSPLATASFDLCLEKGTMDALVSGDYDDGKDRALVMAHEMHRLLKVGGKLVQIADEPPGILGRNAAHTPRLRAVL